MYILLNVIVSQEMNYYSNDSFLVSKNVKS